MRINLKFSVWLSSITHIWILCYGLVYVSTAIPFMFCYESIEILSKVTPRFRWSQIFGFNKVVYWTWKIVVWLYRLLKTNYAIKISLRNCTTNFLLMKCIVCCHVWLFIRIECDKYKTCLSARRWKYCMVTSINIKMWKCVNQCHGPFGFQVISFQWQMLEVF